MPSRLRPTAPVAADAILVGDPGRALMLAQELLEQPRMSNHARGLWGYSGQTAAGRDLTIQATGIGGPSAAAVLADLAKLGVRRAVRVGTCAGVEPEAGSGELLLVTAAVAHGGSGASFGAASREEVEPDRDLLERLSTELGDEARRARVGSFDAMPIDEPVDGIAAADMQTVAVLARGRALGIATASVLIVSQSTDGALVSEEAIEASAKRAGRAATAVLST